MLKVYLSGEIHTDWREQIVEGAQGLDIRFDGPVTDHAASDDCGVAILGAEDSKYWHDHKGAMVNAIRTRKGIEDADVVVVRFGEKYKQWNAAFDAGYAAALGKSMIILQQPEHDHALKEVDAAALAVARTPSHVVDILRYVLTGELPPAKLRPPRSRTAALTVVVDTLCGKNCWTFPCPFSSICVHLQSKRNRLRAGQLTVT